METSSPKFNKGDVIVLNYLNNPYGREGDKKPGKYSGYTARIVSSARMVKGKYQYGIRIKVDADSPRSVFTIMSECKFDFKESPKKLTRWESIKKYLLEW